MLDEAMKVSLTLVAFDKMSKVIRDAVQKSNDDFHKMQAKIKDTSEKMKKFGKTASLMECRIYWYRFYFRSSILANKGSL